MSQLMGLCNRFMLRRTSSVLKQLLPPKVEQVAAVNIDQCLHVISFCTTLNCAAPKLPAWAGCDPAMQPTSLSFSRLQEFDRVACVESSKCLAGRLLACCLTWMAVHAITSHVFCGVPVQVVFCKLSPLQLKLYNAFLQSKPIRALLASTAVEDTATSGNLAEKKQKQTCRNDGTASAMCERHDDQLEDQQAVQRVLQPEKHDLLAPLAAITALKKWVLSVSTALSVYVCIQSILSTHWSPQQHPLLSNSTRLQCVTLHIHQHRSG
jgi:hypothetical protein